MRRGRWGCCDCTLQRHIDPHKIGVLGFSAGGYLVAEISTDFARRLYKPVDAADTESCRPDFAVGVYPGHLWIEGETYALNPNVPVTRQTPPTFLVQAEDDNVDGANQSVAYYIALEKAGVPVEMHLYAQGGHAFWAAPQPASDNGMASVDGDVARDDRENLGIVAARLTYARRSAIQELCQLVKNPQDDRAKGATNFTEPFSRRISFF
jgi:acetyl esterase/lipase